MTSRQHGEFGDLLRMWRQRRGLSQLRLATLADVSQRHLSFLETGRSHPSREMVHHLARHLRVPPREQNQWLHAAGFSPDFTQTSATDLGDIGDALQYLLDAHEPNMAVVVDRYWNLVASNRPAVSFASVLDDPPLLAGELNLMYLMFHPEGFRPHITNFAEVAPTLLWRLRDDLDRAPMDDRLHEVLGIVDDLAGGGLAPAVLPAHGGLVTTVDFEVRGRRFRLFSCLTAIESPTDVTVAELRVETFFPADDGSRATWTELLTSSGVGHDRSSSQDQIRA